jgi:hypothetical protein
VQHGAHFFRREIDARLAVVADDEAVAVAVAFDAAFGFTEQAVPGGGLRQRDDVVLDGIFLGS